MDTAILPLAITMMAGPQILSDLLLVTGRRPIAAAGAFVVAVGAGCALMVFIWMQVAGAVGDAVDLTRQSEPTTTAKVIQLVLVGLLIAAAVKAYLGRETAEPPKWLGKVQDAGPLTAFGIGLLLITVFPSDLLVTMTVGVNLESRGEEFADALPFIGATTAIAALPLALYVIFRRWAEKTMPKVRDWMNTNSWAVNVLVYALFVVLILA
ncbi:MAG TPA: GAP family protein [Thermoleophilaceae bacterium]|nr:GAP family protein [Thermoleophilaceae bacterium]